MKSEARKSKAGIQVALLSGAMGLVLVFSLGIVGRHAASSEVRGCVCVAPATRTEASVAAVPDYSESPEHRMAGHSETELQPD